MVRVWNQEVVGWEPSAEDVAAQPPLETKYVYSQVGGGHSVYMEMYKREAVPPELVYRREPKFAQITRTMQSHIFYSQIGHSEYGGKYPAIQVPRGYMVTDVFEKDNRLEFTLALIPSEPVEGGKPSTYTFQAFPSKPSPAQLRRQEYKQFGSDIAPLVTDIHIPEIGVAESLARYEFKPLLGRVGVHGLPKSPTEWVFPKETTTPFAHVGGAVAPFEATAYGVGSLLGFRTPRIPATLLSFQAGKAWEYGSEYVAGTLVGDIWLSFLAGKAVGKVWEHTPKLLKAPLEKVGAVVSKPFKPLTSRVAARLESLSLYPHERLAPQVVSIPTVERVGLRGLEAEFLAWELAETPKSSALLISRMPSEPLAKAWVFEHLYKTAFGGIAYSMVRESLTKTVPSMPYTPKFDVAVLPSSGLAFGLGMGVSMLPRFGYAGKKTDLSSSVSLSSIGFVEPFRMVRRKERAASSLLFLPKLKPRVYEESFEVQKLRLFPQVYAGQRQRQKMAPMLKLASATAIVSVQEPRTAQISKQALILKIPTPSIQKQTFSFPKMPRSYLFREPNFKRLSGGLRGRWYHRTHALPTQAQVMRQLGFGRKGRRGKKRRR